MANIRPGPSAFSEVFKFVGCRRAKGFEKIQIGDIKTSIRLNILEDIFRILAKFHPSFTPT